MKIEDLGELLTLGIPFPAEFEYRGKVYTSGGGSAEGFARVATDTEFLSHISYSHPEPYEGLTVWFAISGGAIRPVFADFGFTHQTKAGADAALALLRENEQEKRFSIINWSKKTSSFRTADSPPISDEQMLEMENSCDADGFCLANILVELYEVGENDLEGFLDLISERAFGTEYVQEINYEIIGLSSEQELLLAVYGILPEREYDDEHDV